MIKPLLDVFRISMLNRIDGSRKEARDHYIAQVMSEPAYFEILVGADFDRKAAAMPIRKIKTGHTFRRAKATLASIEDKLKNRAKNAREPSASLSKLKAEIKDYILLNLTLPDGKLLRNATGAECKRAGGWFNAVGACIKPTQVVDKHMTEDNLRDIRARFYQANKRRAA